MSYSYDEYLYRAADESFGEEIPDNIETFECDECGSPIGEHDYEIEYEKDRKSIIWTVWHQKCPDEEQP